MSKEIIYKEIEDKAPLIMEVSDKVWEYAELSLLEFKSANLYCNVLRENGFVVEENIADIKTCFKASFGSGRPYIGILGEFDALSGLSQQAGVAYRKEIISGGAGHGCGHNMLGAGSLGAVFGLKKYLSQNKKSGTIIFYGCPGEEGVASKAFMARENMWEELDAVLTWHPDDVNRVVSGTCLSCIQKEYTFKGIASHAAGNPQDGRSALDAVELMNIGVQFLREHMPQSARIHYAITNSGGVSPNVVQPIAKVMYMVRNVDINDAIELQKRVDKIAEAAAMMTETNISVKFIDGCANLVPNRTLEEVLYKNFKEIGVTSYTEKEMNFASEIFSSYEMPNTNLPGEITNEDMQVYDFVKNASENGTKPLNDFLIPYKFSSKISYGSTDVGDVSWQTPTAQINTACFASKSPGHSWQNVSIGKTSIAHKGLLNAAKIMAATAVDLFENYDILKKAKEEFKNSTQKGYTCPIPADVKAEAI